MFKNENDFELLVSRLKIDDTPDTLHREQCRKQLLHAYDHADHRAPSPRTWWQRLRSLFNAGRTGEFK